MLSSHPLFNFNLKSFCQQYYTMDSFDSNYVEGTGLGEFVEIDERTKAAIIKVDSSTFHQIENSYKARGWACISARAEKLSDGIFRYIVTADLDEPAALMYGTFVHFHWEGRGDGIRIANVENARYSRWGNWFPSCHFALRPKYHEVPKRYAGKGLFQGEESEDESGEDDSDDSEDDSVEGKDALIMKFFREFCLPMAEIPEQKEKVEIPAVVRPARRRKHASSA